MERSASGRLASRSVSGRSDSSSEEFQALQALAERLSASSSCRLTAGRPRRLAGWPSRARPRSRPPGLHLLRRAARAGLRPRVQGPT